MKFKSVNELDKFDYTDCIAHSFELLEKEIKLELEALIVNKDNSQNSNYTTSYAGDTLMTLSEGKITRVVKEGYKYYDANDNLINDYPDEEIDVDSTDWSKKFSKTFLISANEVSRVDNVSTITLEFELPDEDPSAITEVYEVTIKADEALVEWDNYMNRVQN